MDTVEMEVKKAEELLPVEDARSPGESSTTIQNKHNDRSLQVVAVSYIKQSILMKI